MAVLIALYRDDIRVWWQRPKLKVSCSKESPWTHKTPVAVTTPQGGWKGEGYYVRLKVTNTGRTRAKKVQVFAAKLRRIGLDGGESEVQEFLPMNFRALRRNSMKTKQGWVS